MDSPPDTHVSLETVATCPHQGEKPCAAGRESRHGDQARVDAQKLLASLKDAGDANRDAQQVAARTRTAFAQATLVRPCSASRNRLMRTRMSGGVGRVTGNGDPYPISLALLFVSGGFDLQCGSTIGAVRRFDVRFSDDDRSTGARRIVDLKIGVRRIFQFTTRWAPFPHGFATRGTKSRFRNG